MNIVSEYIRQNGLKKLQDEYKIDITYHPSLPLIILNYNQIESKPKNNPVIKNCRGLVMELNSWRIISCCIPRFFNWGEETDFAIQNPFNWNKSIATEKIDGSYVAISHYNDEPLITTRSSFGHAKIFDPLTQKELDKTWKEYIQETLGDRINKLSNDYTYIFEFVSPETKVVKQYFKSELYLLTVFNNTTGNECPWTTVYILHVKDFKLPKTQQFNSFNAVYEHVQKINEKELHEGFVLRDNTNQRWKIKGEKYLALHRLRGNSGENLLNPKYIIPLLLANEQDEIYVTYPEIRNTWETIRISLENEYKKLEETLEKTKHIQDQKEFALVIKDCRFTSILFNLKKQNKLDSNSLKKAWLNSSRTILKVLYA